MNSIRTCLICRKKSNPSGMVSFCISGGGLKVAVKSSERFGRGFWICDNFKCMQKLVQKHEVYFRRWLREPVDIKNVLSTGLNAMNSYHSAILKSGNGIISSRLEKRINIFSEICEGRRMP
ncbi:MAG: DUF448 domain-containing protein [Deltaproteobacteria bacterium]|nr:DUF448 domain-containing protein [Deltaproteobacteria bacterium]